MHRCLLFTFALAILLLLAITHDADGAKVLMLLPMASKSHKMVFMPLAEELARRNHQVTLISPYEAISKEPNVKEIDMPNLRHGMTNMKFDVFAMAGAQPLIKIYYMMDVLTDYCKVVLNDTTIKQLASNGKQFDMVIVDAVFNECILPVAYLVSDNVGYLCPTDFLVWHLWLLNIPSPPSTIPEKLVGLPSKMDFFQRLENTLTYVFVYMTRRFKYMNPLQRLMDEANYPGAIPLLEAERKLNFIFFNADPVLTPSSLLSASNAIRVGGMHCHPAKPLPKDLEEFVEGSGEDGFIIFGLGSFAKASDMPVKIREAFVSTFSRLRQRVIWKFEEPIENLPKNVKLVSWMPQKDLLGHPKIRLFITHSGLLSLQEAVYNGVPFIGIPLFAEQLGNIARGVELGIAEKLAITNVTEESVFEVVTKVLSDKKYYENSKKYSVIMKDQLESPLQRAVFWAEYFIRHKGAPHFRNTVVEDLSCFQYYLLDVVGFLAAIACLGLFAVFKVLSILGLVPCPKKIYKKIKKTFKLKAS